MALSPQERETFEEYIKVMTMECTQFICLTSQGEKLPVSSNLFDSAYRGKKDSMSMITVMKPSNKRNIVNSLNTSDNQTIPLEIWTIGVAEPHQPNSLAAVRSEMNLLLKNLLKKASTTVSARLETQLPFIKSPVSSRDQPYETLGDNYEAINVGEVHTPLGTFYVKLAVRTRLSTGPTGKEYLEDNEMFEHLKSLISSDPPKDGKIKYQFWNLLILMLAIFFCFIFYSRS